MDLNSTGILGTGERSESLRRPAGSAPRIMQTVRTVPASRGPPRVLAEQCTLVAKKAGRARAAPGPPVTRAAECPNMAAFRIVLRYVRVVSVLHPPWSAHGCD